MANADPVYVIVPSYPTIVPIFEGSNTYQLFWANSVNSTATDEDSRIARPRWRDEMINGKRAVLVYSKDDVDMALSGVDTKLTDFEKKLRQETIEQVNKIPERLIAGELADKVKDEIIAQMSSDMKQMKSDILEEVRKEIAASRPSH